MSSDGAEAAAVAESYYDSDDADAFYAAVWGGEDIHVGLYPPEPEPSPATVRAASRATVERMATMLGRPPGTRVLDLGAGYGGAARYLAAEHGHRVTCLNISEVQNERNRRQTTAAGLDDLVTVVHGRFEEIPAEDASFDVAWSQEAFLHSGDRPKVLDEIARVLRPGGSLVFTDPMAADEHPDGVLDPILARLDLDSLESPGSYRRELADRGLVERAFDERLGDLRTHYDLVRQILAATADDVGISPEYTERMLTGLGHWVTGADRGHLAWGIFCFDRPA